MEASANELASISGKTKEQCLQALKATNGDPNIAFEYLMSMGDVGFGNEMFGDEEYDGNEGEGQDDYGEEGEGEEGGEGDLF